MKAKPPLRAQIEATRSYLEQVNRSRPRLRFEPPKEPLTLLQGLITCGEFLCCLVCGAAVILALILMADMVTR